MIDEYYEKFKKIIKRASKSWYENEQDKKGTSWKSRLAFDDFLKLMNEYGYEIREGNLSELDIAIQKTADERQNLQDEMKEIEKKIEHLSDTMEQIQVITKYREIYKHYKSNPNDTTFENEYDSELKLYKANANEILKTYDKLPNSKKIYEELEKLQEKKNTLFEEYSLSKSSMNELYSLRKNYETYMGREVER